MDKAPDVAMEVIDARMEVAREEDAKIKDRLLTSRLVAKNFGQNVDELPCIRKPATPRTSRKRSY